MPDGVAFFADEHNGNVLRMQPRQLLVFEDVQLSQHGLDALWSGESSEIRTHRLNYFACVVAEVAVRFADEGELNGIHNASLC